MKIYIIYGFAEGPGLAWELAKHKVTLVNSIEDADVVMTHSGGCFLLPAELPGKTVAILNPVCGPAERLLIVLGKKIWWDFAYYVRKKQFGAWLRKSSWNLWYMATRVPRNLGIARKARYFENKLPSVRAKRVLVINNALDPWATAVPQSEITKHRYTYATLPGPHDDIWLEPKKYLDILQ